MTDATRPGVIGAEGDAAAAAAPLTGDQRLAPDLSTFERSHLRSTPGLYRRAWRSFRRNRVALVALVLLVLVVAFVLAAPLVSALTGFDYQENHLRDKLAAPGEKGYLLGSDGNGRDILTRLAYGGRVSLRIAALATVTLMVIGISYGLVAGYFGGFVDAFMMRLVDVLLSLPTLPLLILVATLYTPGPSGLALILAAVSWPGTARLIRGEVLSLRKREYVEAARVVGSTSPRVLVRHVLPNVTPIALVSASLAVPDLILTETALSFIGLGVQIPVPSWGNMLDEAQRFYRTNWTNVFFPGAMVYITALCLYLVGTALRDALDPRLSS